MKEHSTNNKGAQPQENCMGKMRVSFLGNIKLAGKRFGLTGYFQIRIIGLKNF